MRLPRSVELLHMPSGIVASAKVVRLSDMMIRRRMGNAWWDDPNIDDVGAAAEIDREWDWTTLKLEIGGRLLRSSRLAIMTADGAMQGATMYSTEPVKCRREPGSLALFIELLFVAPRNRHWIRIDKSEQYRGVGLQLLRAVAELSFEEGLAGRLKLESSPNFVDWYKRRGFVQVSSRLVEHDGVKYTPMELPAERAAQLLAL